jgi:Ca2+-binding RTX toxin-like protein
MPTVTVPGASNGSSPVTFTFNAGTGYTVAQQISAALALAVSGGTLSVTGPTGSTPAPGNTGTQELLLSSSPSSTVPAGYGYVINNTQGPATITAAPGTAILSGSFGGTFLESGSATIVAAGGNNIISQSGAGTILLAGGSGNDTITGAGTGSIASGSGSDLINATGGGEYVQLTGADTVVVSAASGTDTIDFSVDSVHGSVLSVTGGANVVLYGAPLGVGSTPATIMASTGADTAFGSSLGSAVYNATNSSKFEFITPAGESDTIVGGATTQATLFGGSGVALTYSSTATTGSSQFVAAGGNETLNASGSAAPVLAWAGTGSDSIVGGSGSDTLVAGSGSVTMTGNGGANYFDIIASRGPATVTITDMNTSDFVQIFGYGATQGQIVATINAATGASFSLTDGTTITFLNTTVSAVKGNIGVSSV